MQKLRHIEPKKADKIDNNANINDFNLNEINIGGFVEIINGDTHLKEQQNKIVQTMYAWFSNMTSCRALVHSGNYNDTWTLMTSGYQMYLGTDTTTPTLYSTIALTSPIGTSPGTAPNTTGGSVTNPSTALFRILFSATWNAGTVSGTVGEMALYLRLMSSAIQSFGWSKYAPATESLQLASRLAVADGSMSSFAINTGSPLTVNWIIQFSYA